MSHDDKTDPIVPDEPKPSPTGFVSRNTPAPEKPEVRLGSILSIFAGLWGVAEPSEESPAKTFDQPGARSGFLN